MEVFSRVLSIFILMVVGYAARKAKAIDKALVRGLSGFILNVAIPFTIIVSFDRSIPRSAMPDLARIGLWAILILGSSAIVATIIFRRFPDDKRKVLSYATVFSNCGFMGFPVAESVFGKIGVMYASIYVIVFQIFIWTYGVNLFMGKSGKSQLKAALLNSGNIAVVLGMAIWLLPFELPGAVKDSIVILSQMTTPLSMIVVGATLVDIPLRGLFSGLELWIGTLIRIVVIPAALFGIMRLFGLHGLPIRVAAFLTAMPAAAQLVIFAERYGANAALASRMVFVSTVLSAITVPVFAVLFG
jgi:predicted permease